MRTSTLDQQTALGALHRRERLYVEIEVGSAWVDLTTYSGRQWVLGASVSMSEESSSATATVRLQREVAGASIAPLVGSNPILAPGRMIRVGCEISEAGGLATGRAELIEGRIDDIAFGEDESVVEITIRDLMALLHDTWVEEERDYGGAAQTVVQAILTDWLPGVTLLTVGDPGFTIRTYTQQIASVERATRGVVDTFGWDYRIRYVSGEWRLVLSEPQDPTETAPTPVMVLGYDDYFEIPDMQLSSLGGRDRVLLQYLNPTGSVRTVVTAETPTPLFGPFYRTVFVDETGNTQVQSDAEALALATAILRAVGRTPLIKSVVLPVDWRLELGDWVRFTPNGVHYSEDFEGAITGISHEFGPDGSQTTVQIRGSFAGGVSRWVSRINRTRLVQDLDGYLPEPEIPAPPPGPTAALYYTKPGAVAGFEEEQTDRDDSLGGFISTSTVTGFGLNDVFRGVTEAEATAGITLYRALAVGNTATGGVWTGVRGWLEEQALHSGTLLEIGVDPAGPVLLTSEYAQGAVIASETTAPAGVTFSAPSDANSGIVLGDIPGGWGVVIWIRLLVTAGTDFGNSGGQICLGTCFPTDPVSV